MCCVGWLVEEEHRWLAVAPTEREAPLYWVGGLVAGLFVSDTAVLLQFFCSLDLL